MKRKLFSNDICIPRKENCRSKIKSNSSILYDLMTQCNPVPSTLQLSFKKHLTFLYSIQEVLNFSRGVHKKYLHIKEKKLVGNL